MKKCNAIYTQNLKGITSDEHVCLMLAAYKLCLVTNAAPCTLDTTHHTLTTVVSRLFSGLCLDGSERQEHQGKSSITGKL